MSAPAQSLVIGTERQVFERYGFSPKTLQNWRSRRQGPPWIKTEGAVRYRFADIEAWLSQNTVTPEK
jgi:predicted DNA-binding transcriptional regulator AlpA